MQPTKTGNLRQAQQLLERGQISSAIKIYQQIVDDDPSDLNTISMLGDLYIKANRTSDAVDHFVRIAGNYLRGGSSRSAAYILNKALKLDASNPKALAGLGELHLHDKQAARAHDAFIEAAAGFWHKGDISAAIGMNQRALGLMPDSRQAKAALEFIRLEMETPQPLPEPQKKEIVRIDLPPIMISIPDAADDACEAPPANQGHPEFDLTPNLVDAETDREFVPGSDEDSIIRQIAVAEFLVGCGQVDRAIALLRGSLQDQPDHIQTREKLKDIYLRSEMIDRAGDECVNIAAIYLARGESSRAAEYIARARLLSPSIDSARSLTTSEKDLIEQSQAPGETGGETSSDKDSKTDVGFSIN
jgi:tetratricopeptide (TPR) repeat protein